ncbi:Gfo/Idh/MocA family oxidoreductase [Acuticoccus sp. MNP-M23]|uniref:Gfo/Idh/MocA family protein n=1 Tax=Acuticoccus sp. MNP-M23 TaxID=3072793 RepID=UPI002815794A|nr:Gfo/Idh/MocA family oxidoreductase [Acuticoccus sp. MNP-M23]WMS41999.1 Gfo/Idh/MocA family oxidoreductase [Acuticoccus sp. MNP-M23]
MAKVRYAVVGSGWISQIAFMPSVAQTDNSEMTAIVTGNPERAQELADFHGIPKIYSYEQYDEMLASGVCDAVYIALPNSMHADYAIRAANAGIHALVEKPLALTVAECEAMIAAAQKAGTLLMTAYRLHNEPATVAILDAIRDGQIGTPRVFSSVFTMQADLGNHRLEAKHWGGPLQDIGVYCLNAMRHVFSAEPVEVIAMDGATEDPRFSEVPEVISATFRFPGAAIATFTASFGAHDLDEYRIVGTEGVIEVSTGYAFKTMPKFRVIRGDDVTEHEFDPVDHFGAQTAYFSDCIQSGTRPESDGEEGLADVRALRAVEESARTGRPVTIETAPRPSHPSKDTVRMIPTTEKRLVF